MRTTGTFQDVYEAAKNYANGNDVEHRPMNPVVRRENGKWMLESGIHSTDGDFEVSLEAFDTWFWESYKTDFVPSDSDVADFVEAHKRDDDEE